MLIVDTDPGIDDTVAIMTLLAAGTKVDAFVSVYGNVPESLTTANMQRVLDLAGETTAARFRGATAPMFGDPVTAYHVHGNDGLGGALEHTATPSLDPVDYPALIRSATDPVTIVALGPLTNVARAIVAAPDVVDRIERIVLMGGAVLTWGNTTPAATFNLVNDPFAAALVYDSGIPLVQAGLDVCRKAGVPGSRLMEFRDSTTETGQFLWRMFNGHHMVDKERGLQDDSSLWFNDGPAIAYLLRPELFATSRLPMMVESEGRFARGATFADFEGVTGRAPNAELLLEIDTEGYIDLVTSMLATYR
ncbi:nucleoside hydrolase [Georgenia sp. Z1491]|uniref:nucleoside hydrolase n=1 Tax=Georgenia sp. Z1491 TaxID=3416707 RepID=UPI003CED5A90